MTAVSAPLDSFPGLDPSWRRAHLVGIGGVGMSAIARVLTEGGRQVSGSDLRESAVLAALRALSIRVGIGHRADRVEGADVVIASAAVPEENVELAAARAAGIPCLARGDALARIVQGRRTVAVSGTHGKTTTSGMIATVLEASGRAPTWLLGADLAHGGPGGRMGSGALAVVEADEAYGSFLWLEPELAVVTNVDVDHLDHYGSMQALQDAFERFVSRAGAAAVCIDDPRAASLVSRG
ncbi:MAG: Mur ligase domain-containing protein, partial [Acidimicrobiales bacterium]